MRDNPSPPAGLMFAAAGPTTAAVRAADEIGDDTVHRTGEGRDSMELASGAAARSQ